MILASHVIWGAYGFWLPNDPRGSWSDFVRSWELFRFGRASHVQTRRSLAAAPHDLHLRLTAKEHLKYPPVTFTGHQARSIARGFAHMCREAHLHLYACSILPQHIHVVIARHHYRVERVVAGLKAAASHRLSLDALHPLAACPTQDGSIPSPWAHKCWKVFLDTEQDIARAQRYVENNPCHEGLPPQRWSFVTPLNLDPPRPTPFATPLV